MSKQPVRVQIFHQYYSLVADGDPAEVADVASQVDELMTSIAARISTGDSTRVAVLACMHMADQLRAAEKRLQNFENESERMASLLDKAFAETSLG